MTEPDFVEAIHKGFTRAFFDESAERNLRHTHVSGEVFEADVFLVVCAHKLKRLLDTSAVVVEGIAGAKTIGGQHPHISGCREVMEDRKQLQDRIEAIHLRQVMEAWKNSLGRFGREQNPL